MHFWTPEFNPRYVLTLITTPYFLTRYNSINAQVKLKYNSGKAQATVLLLVYTEGVPVRDMGKTSVMGGTKNGTPVVRVNNAWLE
jgi:hypothetical protein